MGSPTPFAYGPLGEILVATDDRWVCVSPERGQSPQWSFEAAAPVAGVRNTRAGVLVVDARGGFTQLARADGVVLGQIDCAVAALALAATLDGVWAIGHPGGVCLGQGAHQLRRLSYDALTCASLDEMGRWLAVGTQAGDVHTLDLTTGERHRLRLRTPITGLTFSRRRQWYICTEDLLYRADLDLTRHKAVIESGHHASGCVASPDGSLCALRVGRHRVIVIGHDVGELGYVYYPDRLVGEIEFGPFAWLGVGIGSGDGNRVSILEEDLIFRTPVLPGRPENEWFVGSEFEREKVLEEREKVRAQGLLPPGEEAPLEAVAAEDEDEDEEEEDEDESEDEEPLDAEAASEAPRRPREAEARPGTPFVLEPHERVLVHGGFGGKFPWSWTICLALGCLAQFPFMAHGVWVGFSQGRVLFALTVLAVMAVFVFAAAWPFLRSGTYWLTNLRLYWKPRLGPAVTVLVPGIDPKRLGVWPILSSLHIHGDPSVSLRYISDLDRLWGGLILFGQLDEFEPSEPGERTEDVACWPAERVEMMSTQQGMAVLRPEYFAFLPSEESVNLIGKAVGHVGRELVGKVLDGVEIEKALGAKLPIDLLLEVLCEQHPHTFDAYIYQTVEQQEGLVWEPGEAEATREAFPLQPSRHVLIFRRKGCAVRGVPTREHGPFIDRVLRTWSEDTPIPVRQPIWRLVKASLIFTVPALLFAWGGYSLAGDPEREAWESGLAYGFAGVLGVLGLLCWLLTAVVTGRALRAPVG